MSDLARYRRQIVLREVGVNGQQLLRDSSVLIVGVGGLGCAAAPYLVGAGLGRVLLTDIGQQIADRARIVLREVEDMRSLARRTQDPESGTFTGNFDSTDDAKKALPLTISFDASDPVDTGEPDDDETGATFGTPARAINSFAKILLPSRRAAALPARRLARHWCGARYRLGRSSGRAHGPGK